MDRKIGAILMKLYVKCKSCGEENKFSMEKMAFMSTKTFEFRAISLEKPCTKCGCTVKFSRGSKK